MSTELRFLGVAGYEIASPTARILIDPFLDFPRAPVRPDDVATPDVILVSHAAFDHVGATAAIARRTGAPVVCGGDVRLALLDAGVPEDQIRATVWGIVVEVGGVVVRPVECHHWSMATLSDGRTVSGNPLAFVVEPEPGLRLYHYGDTAIFDMTLIARLYRPTVALIGCSQPQELLQRVPGPGRVLTGELSPDEAALVADMLDVELAVASHYIDVDDDVRAFLARVGSGDAGRPRRAVAPAVGQTLVLEAPATLVEPAVAT
jgi:L-ascorbate metabolism protein UlaG (beta-lactamase superfamily)